MSATAKQERTPAQQILEAPVVTEDEVCKLITDTFNGLVISDHVLSTIKSLCELFTKTDNSKTSVSSLKWLTEHADTLKEHIGDIVLYQPHKDVYFGPLAAEFKQWRATRAGDTTFTEVGVKPDVDASPTP